MTLVNKVNDPCLQRKLIITLWSRENNCSVYSTKGTNFFSRRRSVASYKNTIGPVVSSIGWMWEGFRTNLRWGSDKPNLRLSGRRRHRRQVWKWPESPKVRFFSVPDINRSVLVYCDGVCRLGMMWLHVVGGGDGWWTVWPTSTEKKEGVPWVKMLDPYLLRVISPFITRPLLRSPSFSCLRFWTHSRLYLNWS